MQGTKKNSKKKLQTKDDDENKEDIRSWEGRKQPSFMAKHRLSSQLKHPSFSTLSSRPQIFCLYSCAADLCLDLEHGVDARRTCSCCR
jgi:hypothetical protein